MERCTNKGNVLFLILIAVALFAALAYAVTSSSRSGGSSISKEKGRALAAQVMQHAASVRAAAMRITMDGTPIGRISALSPAYIRKNGDPIMENGDCLVLSCQVFHPKGGGVVPITIQEKWALDNALYDSHSASAWRPGHFAFYGGIVGDIGTMKADVLLVTPYISTEFCKAFNDYVGVTNPGGNPPVNVAIVNSLTSEAGLVDAGAVGIGNEAPELIGKDAFCLKNGTMNNIMIVIQAR